MNTLRNRRILQDLVFLHKLISNQISCIHLSEKIHLSVPYNLPRKPINKIFHIHTSKTNTGLHAPMNRICQEYNEISTKLPNIDIFSDSLPKFQSGILQLFSV
ncbi:hypothetical protein JYU34_019784 [Plutella xylostella]|uniref:Uncharacterized protein n=1 Tax=Plutella xylostella TaxID=51655 RepID=A0ABQ7PV98_PLUXY|nr:hypothetical protein JYU34_019784 [Plutella xylostella]